MDIKKSIIVCMLCIQCAYAGPEVVPTEVTLADIIAAPVTDNTCHAYCFTGVCVWMTCTIFGCDIDTSPRVRHNNPDFIVSTFDEPGTNPWVDANAIYSSLNINMTEIWVDVFRSDVEPAGGSQVEGGSGVDNSLRWKEVDVLGHPVASIAAEIAGSGFWCPSETDAYYPYYLSGFDTYEWRLGLFETVLSLPYLFPGVRVVGDGFYRQWGSVHPRTGAILQKDDVKAAAMISQRAGNIVTGNSWAHLVNQPDGNGYSKTWLPGELRENDASTGVWQMIAPKTDTQCYVFGEDDTTSLEPYSEDRNTDDNKYVYALWREYECCERVGASLIYIAETEVCL